MEESYELDLGSDPRCRECGVVLPAAAVICVKCGTHQRTGKRLDVAVQTMPAKGRARGGSGGAAGGPTKLKARPKPKEAFGEVCSECGYDLTTIPGKPCPECGGRKRINAARLQKREAELKRYWKNTILTGSIAGVLGVGATMALAEAYGNTWFEGLIYALICLACIQAAYFGMCLLWFGFEETIRGTAIRLIGVGAVWAALMLVVGHIPLPTMYGVLISCILTILSVACPIKWLVDREWYECMLIGLGAFILRVIVFLATGGY